MHRRQFLTQFTGVAALAMGCGQSAFAYKTRRHRAPKPPTKLDRIAVSSWSLRNYFRATRDADFKLPGPLIALLDFPEAIVNRYQIHHFEFCASHFPSTETAYLREMKYTLTHASSSLVNVAVDIDVCGPQGTFSDPDHQARLAALDAVRPWVDVAHDLGAKSVSVGPGKLDPENLERTAESYKAIAAYAQTKGVRVMVENQNGFGGEQPEDLTKLIRLAGPGRLGVIPNFSNFPDEAARSRGLNLFLPLASSECRAGGAATNADGTSNTAGISPAVEIAKQEGFGGFYTIAFDGPGDPYRGIQVILDELMRCV